MFLIYIHACFYRRRETRSERDTVTTTERLELQVEAMDCLVDTTKDLQSQVNGLLSVTKLKVSEGQAEKICSGFNCAICKGMLNLYGHIWKYVSKHTYDYYKY